ncbi:MAG: DUF4157 domain-containing protein [Acidobacteria bacterium]|nr:DUF4157 domain-containing protein [Acidobacteriota bacterium]
MKRQGEPLPLEVQQLLAPFFPGFDLSRVRIFEGIPRYVSIAAAAEPIGYTDRNRIYFAPGAYRIDTPEGLALIAHEVVHCRQYHELGKWKFRAKYLSSYFQNRWRGMNDKVAYAQIPFEIEAREVERKVLSALFRLQSELLPIE